MPGQQSPPATKAASRLAPAIHADSAQGVAASPMREAPSRDAQRLFEPYFSQIYMMDLVEGGMTIIAAEPSPGSRPLWYGEVVA